MAATMCGLSPLIGSWAWVRMLVGLALLAGLLQSCAADPKVSAKSAADYFVHSLPGAPEGVPLVKMHAGHVEVTPDKHGHLFFWHFQNRHIADKPRTVIWLNGGPGCSSEDGALMEIGPYRVRKGDKLELVNGTWNEFANLLFVDNPVGTGFSYVGTDSYVTELQQMADQFMTFLTKWFTMFPEYMHDDLYMAGESYAGQHIPYIARAILDRNKKVAAHSKWNLQGLLIGNGWIQGSTQYPAYLRYAYDHGLLARGSAQAQAVEAKMNICNALLSSGGSNRVDVPECEAVLSEILLQTSTSEGGSRMCYNMYDVRLKDRHPSCGMSWPPDLEQVTPYLRRKDVAQYLHIKRDDSAGWQGWQECNGKVGQAFRALNSAPSFTLLPGILAEIPIVLFSGDKDLICNHLGTEELIHNLEWNGGKGFELGTGSWAPRRAWSFENQPAGFYQSARNLTYILFYNSSHMVPFDHPRRTRDMLDRFMGVNIGPIGGSPVMSVIDGETAPVTSVGGTPNSTQAQQEQGERIKDAEWKAYRKSGEVALVVVALAAAAWGFFVWRARRRAGRGPGSSSARYKGLWTSDPDDEEEGIGLGLNGDTRRARRRANGDVEAGDFDETRLRDDEDDDDEDEGADSRVPAEGRFSVRGESEVEGDKRDGGG